VTLLSGYGRPDFLGSLGREQRFRTSWRSWGSQPLGEIRAAGKKERAEYGRNGPDAHEGREGAHNASRVVLRGACVRVDPDYAAHGSESKLDRTPVPWCPKGTRLASIGSVTRSPRNPKQEPNFDGSNLALVGANLYRLLVEKVEDYAIFALDANAKVLTWNAGAARITGYREEEILGKSYSTFYPPADVAAGKPKKLLALAASGGHVQDEGWRVRKDGTQFWADVTLTALRDDSGVLLGYAKVTRDLTERRAAEEALRESEERFRLAVTTVKDYGIFMLDSRGRIVTWNEGAQRIKGYKAEEIVGRHFSVFYPEKDLAANKPERELKVAARVGRFEDEDWRVRKDGSLFWANVIITALRNHSGQLVGFVKVTRDLTERKAAEQRAIADARRVAEAESSNRAKTEFLAAMSHELRTPLNAIGGYAELMEIGVAGEISDQQREYLTRIQNGQQHLLAIINDLLNYSRIESGQIAYEIEPVDMHQVVENVLDLVTPQAHRKHISVSHGPCHDQIIATGDRLKTEQIVLNLLSNAVKFTGEGGRVTTTCGIAGGNAYVTVDDTGPGIPADKTSAIFEPFVQLGRSLSTIREGTGLGLAISRDLARAMGGDITVDSDPGRGAQFTLALPLAQSDTRG
jgi:PAS domain S-box-containing protein